MIPILSNEDENEKVYTFDVNNEFWNGKHVDVHILVSSNLTNQNLKVR